MTYTLPTVTDLEDVLTNSDKTGTAFIFRVVNLGTSSATAIIAAGTGWTITGSLTMTIPVTTGATLVAVLGASLMLQGCLVGAVVGTAGAIVGGAAQATGAVVGAGVDAVTTSDEETKARREREQRAHEREQRRCEQRQRQGRDC